MCTIKVKEGEKVNELNVVETTAHISGEISENAFIFVVLKSTGTILGLNRDYIISFYD